MRDEEIIETYGNTVYAIAVNYARNRFDADDIYSETFLRYFSKKRRFESEEHRKAYLIRMTINCAKDFLSDMRRHSAELCENTLPDAGGDEELLYLKETLESLDAEERNLIYLFYYHGMKSAEIAALLAISDDAVRTRLKRAREKMKEFMSQ